MVFNQIAVDQNDALEIPGQDGFTGLPRRVAQFMYHPWLTTSDCPVSALEGKAANRWATSATSSIVVNS